MPRRVVIGLAAAWLACSQASPAHAHHSPTHIVDGGAEEDAGTIEVWVRDHTPGFIASGPDDPCDDWALYSGADGPDLPYQADEDSGLFINRHDDGTISVLYFRFCDNEWEYLWANQGITLEGLALQARDEITPPPLEPTFSPPGSTVRTIVGIDTWFWVPEAQWQPLTASATAGGTTVTATATPLVLRFTPGDGSEPVECVGPGVEWAEGAETECAYVYQYVSAHHGSRAWPATLEVEWDVTWEANTGQTGFLDPLFTVTDTPMFVDEVQVIVHSPSLPPGE